MKKRMMHLKNERLDAVLRELDAVDIKPTVDQVRRGTHIKIRWQGPDGKPRTYVVCGHGGSPRAEDQARTGVRRILRQDGLIPANSNQAIRDRCA